MSKFWGALQFEDRGLVWEWIGGKVGDMIRLYEKKQGYSEEEGLNNMLKDEAGRLRDLLEAVEEGEKGDIGVEGLKETLKLFKEKGVYRVEAVKRTFRKFLIQENILFYNPVEGTVRPQGTLIHKAIEKIIN